MLSTYLRGNMSLSTPLHQFADDTQSVKSETLIELRSCELIDFPVAIVLGEKHLHWHDGELWEMCKIKDGPQNMAEFADSLSKGVITYPLTPSELHVTRNDCIEDVAITISQAANKCLFVGDNVYTQAKEPVYKVTTKALGTSNAYINLHQCFESDVPLRGCFGATEYNEALAYTNQIITEHNEIFDCYITAKTEYQSIEVLLTEAVRFLHRKNSDKKRPE
jgi:hypothetical protein